MYTKNDWSKAAINLTKRTLEGKVLWGIPNIPATDEGRTITQCFEATYKDMIYLIVSYKTQNWIDDVEYYWEEYIVLEIWKPLFGNRHIKLAVSPVKLSALEGLMRTVEGKFAVDQNALGALLEDD